MRKSNSVERCGIVLAAGEGKRIRPFIYQLRGDFLPKQYVNFIGKRSILEHTVDRARILVAPERLFTVVDVNHLDFPDVRRQLSSHPKGTVITQPGNKETAPGLLLPLSYIYKYYPNSVVAVFPSDHFIFEERLFMNHVETACRFAESNPSSLVILGMEPNSPEVEYGYILPSGEVKHFGSSVTHRVERFVEKPSARSARMLVRRGGLWNTLVIVFKAKTLFKLCNRIMPGLYTSFQRILEAIGTPREEKVVEQVYQTMEPVNLSRELLEALPLKHPSCLSLLKVRGVYWSDWGTQERILAVLRERNLESRLNKMTMGRLDSVGSKRNM